MHTNIRTCYWGEMMDVGRQMTSSGEGSNDTMDSALWGQLQYHINLATTVYVKLPIGDFFRLRLVCKEWNRLASDRGFLEEIFRDPIPEPYFVVGNPSFECGFSWNIFNVANQRMKSRLLSYDGSSRRWSWTRVPDMFCEAMAGMFFESFIDKRVFSVHTRVFYDPTPARRRAQLGPYDNCYGHSEESLMGMTVDTSVRPYTVQIILGDDNDNDDQGVVATRIYHSESDSWTHNPSTLPCVDPFANFYKPAFAENSTSCVLCNDILYIRTFEKDGLYSYNLKKEEWDYNSPAFPDDAWIVGDFGAWQGRLFFFGLKGAETQSSCAITVFELSNHYDVDSWTVFDHMPDDLCLHLLAGQEGGYSSYYEGSEPRKYRQMDMKSVFCGEYVLVYNILGGDEMMERAVLYSFDRKTWERVDLPGDHAFSPLILKRWDPNFKDSVS
ncbi:hypothetical protein M758_10G136400 [Ceratodon purpureus]|nr:hypothetical protein M758_10G136400 [Ceratodon purpureus]